MKPAPWILLLACCVGLPAAAQQKPAAPASAPARAASAPAKATVTAPTATPARTVTAPTDSTERTLQEARLPVSEGGVSQVTPQVAIPLSRNPNNKPVPLKPGKADNNTKWNVDDSAARCLAEKDPATRAQCEAKLKQKQ